MTNLLGHNQDDELLQCGEAKAHLSEILEEVRSGQEVVLTKRGQPIARVIPIERTSSILGAGEHDDNINSVCPGTRYLEKTDVEFPGQGLV